MLDEQKCKRTYEKDEERTLTGKEYLIDYMQNHSSEEIYDLIKSIEEYALQYNDSKMAFIGFLDGDDVFESYFSLRNIKAINVSGEWIYTAEECEAVRKLMEDK